MTCDDQLAELFVRWKTSLSNGMPLTPEEICRECPELLAEFRERLPAFAAVDVLFDDMDLADVPIGGENLKGAGYSSVSFHKEGGLAVILVGEDVQLHRTVAIKRLKPHSLSKPGAREQFLAEAEITARLDHPGVVPVYRTGHDDLGQPYYSMRFMHNGSLGEAIEAYHRNRAASPVASNDNHEFRRLIRCVKRASETLAYAHSRGVIHRDLKPENIMLGSFEEVLVVDWGLAKRFDQPVADETAETSTPVESASGQAITVAAAGATQHGDIKGSPAFMSPEQAKGDIARIGPSTDIYSLGATLYVLLTGQRPYKGENVLDVIAKVEAGTCPPPEQVNPSVPKALAAICRKSMSHATEDRYGTMLKFAEDLQRWMDDEPVSAWPDPLTVRMQRWMRKHRTLATSAVVALVLLTLAMITLAVQERRIAGKERAARERLSTSYTKLRQVMVIFQNADGDAILEPEVQEALADAKRHFQQLTREGSGENLFELVALENLEGAFHIRQKNPALALPVLKRAAELCDAPLRVEPNNPVWREVAATVWLNLGAAQMQQVELTESLLNYEKSLAFIESLARDNPHSIKYARLRQKVNHGMANCHFAIASQLWVAHEFTRAGEHFQKTHDLIHPLATVTPELPGTRSVYHDNLTAWGQMLRAQGAEAQKSHKAVEAVPLYEKAIQIRRDLESLGPQSAKANAWLNDHDWLDLTSELLAWACQQSLDEMDSITGSHRDEAQRLMQLGIAALKALPAPRQARTDLADLRADLERRLKLLQYIK